MINVIISFHVFEDKLFEAIEVIKIFVNKVNDNEQGTLFYKSFQDKKDPTRFLHVMSFNDEESQNIHRKSEYCAAFVKDLYPLCCEAPFPQMYTDIH